MKVGRLLLLLLVPLLGVAWWFSPLRDSLLRYPTKPRLFKSTVYPPQTDEEKAMWEWYKAIRKVDPNFEWKSPIEFYGKVVDQFGDIVPGAQVTLQWSAMAGTPEKIITTGGDGKFSFRGVKGKGLSVEISKKGYLRTNRSYGSFEYAIFSNSNFYVPDSSKPVIFRLQKLIGAEPLDSFVQTGKISLDGTPLTLNVATGKIGSGDISFSITLGDSRTTYGPDYILTIQGTGGAGFVASNDEFLFQAPESGYQNSLQIKQVGAKSRSTMRQKLGLYVKTSDGKYAALGVEIAVHEQRNNADFLAGIFFNPSGSRNLEHD